MEFVSLISLNAIDKVKAFVNVAITYAGDIELHSGRYVIDGKSIMGIFSIDISKKVELWVSDINSDECKEFIETCTKLGVM